VDELTRVEEGANLSNEGKLARDTKQYIRDNNSEISELHGQLSTEENFKKFQESGTQQKELVDKINGSIGQLENLLKNGNLSEQ
jgi:hypothetical protein